MAAYAKKNEAPLIKRCLLQRHANDHYNLDLLSFVQVDFETVTTISSQLATQVAVMAKQTRGARSVIGIILYDHW